jgi:hypothetical protein
MSTTKIVDGLEAASRFLYGWLADNDDLLGTIVYVVHSLLACTMVVLVVVSHTIYPVVWFQALVFGVIFCVWVQHVVLKTCVLTSLERRLLTSEPTVDPVLDMFGIPVSQESRTGVTLMISTIATALLGLELVARGVLWARVYVGASPWV